MFFFPFLWPWSLTFRPNTCWLAMYRDGLSLCQVWRFLFKLFWFYCADKQTDTHRDNHRITILTRLLSASVTTSIIKSSTENSNTQNHFNSHFPVLPGLIGNFFSVTISCIYYFVFTISLYFMHFINLSGYLAASVQIKPVDQLATSKWHWRLFEQHFSITLITVEWLTNTKFWH